MDAIYLDYAAGTPVDPQVAERMSSVLHSTRLIANPSSTHLLGREAAAEVERCRALVAAAIGAEAGEIIWTSGATEANNLAIKGAAGFYRERGKHLVSSRTEHRSVLDSCRYLEGQGHTLSYAQTDAGGRVTADAVEAQLRDDTVLVSVMWVNNETGVINDIPAIAKLTRARGILLHVDAAQALGRVPINLAELPIDLLSLTAQKAYGPRGIGALFVRRTPRARLAPLFHGGGHEQGMRSGTLSVHQIAGFAEAAGMAVARLSQDMRALATMRDGFDAELLALGDVNLNGNKAHRVAAISNVGFGGVNGEAMRSLLGPLCVSGGSACSAATAEPSFVLRALGLSDERAGASLRFSLGRYTTAQELQRAVQIVGFAVRRLRAYAGQSGQQDRVPSDLPRPPEMPEPVWQELLAGEGLGEVREADYGCRSRAESRAHHAKLSLGLNLEDGLIRQSRIQVSGCPYTIACAAWLSRHLLGAELQSLSPQALADDCASALEIPESRRHCVILIEDLVRNLS